MTKNTFKISADATGKPFIYQTTSELTKNHNENDNTTDTNGEGRVYETNGPKCPVACFKKMLKHLNPNIDALWQRPRAKISIKKEIWYCNVPLGEKTLGSMLPILSEKYGLSQRYTNHSLRETSMQVLEDGNVETWHIVRVSGHKNPDSVSNYARRLSAAKKRNLSSILAESLGAGNITRGSPQEIGASSSRPHFYSQNATLTSPLSTSRNISQVLNLQESGASSSSSLSSLHSMNVVPGSFTPIISNCSNITFNVYTTSKWTIKSY